MNNQREWSRVETIHRPDQCVEIRAYDDTGLCATIAYVDPSEIDLQKILQKDTYK